MSVPLVFWGRRPPTHEITCICKSEDKRGIATASRSGQICLWEVYKDRDTEKVKVFLHTLYDMYRILRIGSPWAISNEQGGGLIMRICEYKPINP